MTNKRIRYKPVDPVVASIAEIHGSQPEHVLAVFQDLQSRRGGLNSRDIEEVARALGISAERSYGVASFYSMLDIYPNDRPLEKKRVIRICDGPVCYCQGSTELHAAAKRELGINWRVERSSCLGLCDRAPAALVDDQQAGPIAPAEIQDVANGWRGQPTDYSQPRPGELRVMMAKAGKVDPDSIDSALENGAYQALAKTLGSTPEAIVAEVEASGLAGRGGAGFPVGRKWRFVAQEERTPKYVICNADESEPLIFKDRVLMDTDPHQILEGMAIAGYAVGASEAFIYIRGEYEYQARRLERAIQQAHEHGWLGPDIRGSGFSFHVHVHRGAGAYICGEETALIESLEGKRGEPRFRPPYPPSNGYMGMPTMVNNVESYAAVPAIIQHGAQWYRDLSSWRTPGTKIYLLLGALRQPGLFEAPFGITLRQAIESFGGGMQSGSEFNFALTGGAAGTLVPPELLDVPIDYASSMEGVSLGAGAFFILDKNTSPVSFLREILHFFWIESCGKCTPCRQGTFESWEILTRLSTGTGKSNDVLRLHELADVMQAASLCGLGQSVAIPVKSALTHFAEDFLAGEG